MNAKYKQQNTKERIIEKYRSTLAFVQPFSCSSRFRLLSPQQRTNLEDVDLPLPGQIQGLQAARKTMFINGTQGGLP